MWLLCVYASLVHAGVGKAMADLAKDLASDPRASDTSGNTK